jgi:hypothetical protein
MKTTFESQYKNGWLYIIIYLFAILIILYFAKNEKSLYYLVGGLGLSIIIAVYRHCHSLKIIETTDKSIRWELYSGVKVDIEWKDLEICFYGRIFKVGNIIFYKKFGMPFETVERFPIMKKEVYDMVVDEFKKYTKIYSIKTYESPEDEYIKIKNGKRVE